MPKIRCCTLSPTRMFRRAVVRPTGRMLTATVAESKSDDNSRHTPSERVFYLYLRDCRRNWVALGVICPGEPLILPLDDASGVRREA